MELTSIPDFDNSISVFHLSNKYCINGIHMADEGQLREALENFNKAIDTNPNNHIAFFNRATIKIDLGDLEGAKKDFHKFDLMTKK